MGITPKQSYEDALGDALEALIGEEVLEIDKIAEGLNARNVHGPNGERWDVGLLTAELARLGQ
jgi:hypothetical protein